MAQISREQLPEFLFPRVNDAFSEYRIKPPEAAAYVTGVLVKFARKNRMYSPLGEVGEERWQTDYVSEMREAAKTSEGRMRLVIYQHLGDFTLFMLGIFPEHVIQRGAEGLYHDSGRMSYGLVAMWQDYSELSSLFSGLADNFDACVSALSLMRERYFHITSSSDLDLRKLIDSF